MSILDTQFTKGNLFGKDLTADQMQSLYGLAGTTIGAIGDTVNTLSNNQYKENAGRDDLAYLTYGNSWGDVFNNSSKLESGLDTIRSLQKDYSDVQNTTSLINAWNSNDFQDTIRDSSEVGGVIGSALTDAGKFGAAGTKFGPLGTAIGAGVGLISGLTRGLIISANQHDKNVERANAEILRANRAQQDSFYDTNDAIKYRQARQDRMNYFDEGGSLEELNGVTKFNVGGTHSQNPYDGIQQGIASDGLPNLVEEGELKYNDYIYSARLKPSKSLLKQYNLPEKYAGKSFAEIGDILQKESEERPNDPISKTTLDEWMLRLQNAQEEYKAKAEERRLAKVVDNMSNEEKAALLSSLEQPMAQQEGIDLSQPMYAKGGILYRRGGPLSKEQKDYLTYWQEKIKTNPELLLSDNNKSAQARTWLINHGYQKVIDDAYDYANTAVRTTHYTTGSKVGDWLYTGLLPGASLQSSYVDAPYASNEYRSKLMKRRVAERPDHEGTKNFALNAALGAILGPFTTAKVGVPVKATSRAQKAVTKAERNLSKARTKAAKLETAADKSIDRAKGKITEKIADVTTDKAIKAQQELETAKQKLEAARRYQRIYGASAPQDFSLVEYPLAENVGNAIKSASLQFPNVPWGKLLPALGILGGSIGGAYGISTIPTSEKEEVEIPKKAVINTSNDYNDLLDEFGLTEETAIEPEQFIDLGLYAEGGKIHIKPSKRGTFTAAAKKHGKSVQAFASQVLANKENYSPAMVKKANFARNASKWSHKHDLGGPNNIPFGAIGTGVQYLLGETPWQKVLQNIYTPGDFANDNLSRADIPIRVDKFATTSGVITNPQEVKEGGVSRVKFQPRIENNNDSSTSLGLSSLRYAPAVGAGLGALVAALQPVDYTLSNKLEQLSSEYKPIGAPHISGYRRYTPYDINLGDAENIGLTAQALAANRGQNRATQGALNAAVLAKAQETSAKRNLAWQQANEANRLATDQYNLGIDQFNAQRDSQYDQLNQQMLNNRINLLGQAAQAADASRTAWANMLNTTGTNFFNQLGNVGKDIWTRNQRDALLTALGAEGIKQLLASAEGRAFLAQIGYYNE